MKFRHPGGPSARGGSRSRQPPTLAAAGRRWIYSGRGRSPPGAGAPALDRALVHWILASTSAQWARGEEVGVYVQQALTGAQVSGDPHLLGPALYVVGVAEDFCGDFDRATAAIAQAIAYFRAAGSEVHVWFVQADLADKRILQGDLETAVPMPDEVLMRLRQISSHWFVVITISQGGFAALRAG
jgi:hypothetical protein